MQPHLDILSLARAPALCLGHLILSFVCGSLLHS